MTRRPPEVPANSSTRPTLRPLRDISADDRSRWLKGFAWGACPGVFIGSVVLVTHGAVAGIVVFLVLTLGAGGVAMAVSESAGALVRGVTNPKGRPGPGAHSGVDALVARGEAEKAITTLRVSLDAWPDDPEAHIRIARILRDELAEPHRALDAFRDGRASGCFTVRHMRVTMREMLELARKLGEAERVRRDLEAHRDLFAESDEAAWAARELADFSRLGDASAS